MEMNVEVKYGNECGNMEVRIWKCGSRMWKLKLSQILELPIPSFKLNKLQTEKLNKSQKSNVKSQIYKSKVKK